MTGMVRGILWVSTWQGAVAVMMATAVAVTMMSVPVVAADAVPTADAVDIPGMEKQAAADLTQLAGVEELTERAKKSVVVISFTGRDGQREGLGSGVIVDPNGLIATNRHVIGDARPITVEMSNGDRHEVTAIHATDRLLDLAVLKIDAEGLPALPLGNPDELRNGQPVLAIGNPLGLELSVVVGVVSGRREIDDRSMIQLAIPIERGNSGGPLLDLNGNVHGLITLKSAVADNLGFAVPVDLLQKLLDRPNPVPMSRWLTIGVLDARDWQVDAEARWRQRAGRILVSGRGGGFGGRAKCLSTVETPERPFEVAVEVRLDDEDGAAGIAFFADGGDKHYGFYPSTGALRMSRFDGPDVFNWRVLEQVRSKAYRPGEWNHLKVRVEEGRVLCYCNDELVIESDDRVYTSGRVGLVKFRETSAEFRRFEVGSSLPNSRPDPDVAQMILEITAPIDIDRPAGAETLDSLQAYAASVDRVLQEEARELERRAKRLRQLADDVRRERIRGELASELAKDEAEIDLLKAALLIAKIDNADVEVPLYVQQVDRLAEDILATLTDESDAGASSPVEVEPDAKLAALNTMLFQELGFHGSRQDYYNASNSYLNEVIDDREGLPITLAVLYIDLARRIGLNVRGIGLPGHFVVQYRPDDGEPMLIDVFEGGVEMSRQDAIRRVVETSGLAWDDEYLTAQSKREIIVRMLRNLLGIARDDGDPEQMLAYVETLSTLDPGAAQERWFRAILRFQTQRLEGARADTGWLIDNGAPGLDLFRVRELDELIAEELRRIESLGG